MTRWFVYEHPAGAGLGAHHAQPGDPPLRKRPAAPGVSMADLDMPPGTVVTLAGRDDDRDLELVDWADALGNGRRTSVTPGFFAAHFREVGG